MVDVRRRIEPVLDVVGPVSLRRWHIGQKPFSQRALALKPWQTRQEHRGTGPEHDEACSEEQFRGHG